MRGVADPREPAAFAVVVLVGFVVAKFLSVAVHEVLGHGLFTELVGGTFYGVYVSPGSGFSLIYLPSSAPVAAGALVSMAGILVDVLVGIAIYAAYPRARTFLARLFALLLLQTFLVYSLLYLALGAVEGTAGDSAATVAQLGAPHLTAAFLVVGLAWAVGAAYGISAELTRLVAPGAPLRRQFVYLALFWFAPVATGVVPGLATARSSLLLYFVLFLAIGGVVFAAAVFLASRLGPATRARVARPTGHLAPLVVAFALVLPLWVGVFGLTDGSAHGVLVQEPPLQAESTLSGSQAIDVRVDLTADQNASLVLRMKELEPLDASPLEDRVFASFDARADFAYWRGTARYLAAGMLNASGWNVVSTSIDANGTIWSGGRLYGSPRMVGLGIARAEDRMRVVTVSVVGNRTLLRLVVYDPFRANRLPDPCDGCYLDEVNLTWPSGAPEPFRLVEADGVGGLPSPLPLIGFNPASGLHYARWRNRSSTEASATYGLVLEIL